MLRGSGDGGEGRTSSLGCGETKFWGRGLFGVSCEVSKQARSKRHGDCARAPRGADRRSGALIARVAGATWLRAPSPSSPPHSPHASALADGPATPSLSPCACHHCACHSSVYGARVCARISHVCTRMDVAGLVGCGCSRRRPDAIMAAATADAVALRQTQHISAACSCAATAGSGDGAAACATAPRSQRPTVVVRP